MSKIAKLDADLSARLTLDETDSKWPPASKIAHTGDGQFIFGVLALAGIYGWIVRDRIITLAALTILLSLVVTATAVVIIKYSLRRERPRDPTGFVHLSSDKYSFPSGHSARMTALAGAVIFFSLPLGLLLFAIALTVAAARVAVGVHYVSDVTVGLALGTLISVTVGNTVL